MPWRSRLEPALGASPEAGGCAEAACISASAAAASATFVTYALIATPPRPARPSRSGPGNVIANPCVRIAAERHPCLPRGRIELRILDGEPILQTPVGQQPEALRQNHLIGMRQARGVQRGDVGEAYRANDERVTFPAADGESHRRRVEEVGLRIASHVDDSEPAIPAMDEGHAILAADDLERIGHQQN